jgi:hypothetical protein
VDEQLREMDATLANADDGCAKEAGATHLKALRSFKAASTAATNGDEAALDEALDRAFELQADSQEELHQCGLGSTSGVDGVLIRAVQSSYLRIQRPSAALRKCETFDCLSRQGARLEEAIDEGLDQLTPAIEAAENACLKEAARGSVEALRAYRDMAIAAQENDTDSAAAARRRGFDLEIEMAEKLQDCGGFG